MTSFPLAFPTLSTLTFESDAALLAVILGAFETFLFPLRGQPSTRDHEHTLLQALTSGCTGSSIPQLALGLGIGATVKVLRAYVDSSVVPALVHSALQPKSINLEFVTQLLRFYYHFLVKTYKITKLSGREEEVYDGTQIRLRWLASVLEMCEERRLVNSPAWVVAKKRVYMILRMIIEHFGEHKNKSYARTFGIAFHAVSDFVCCCGVPCKASR